MPTSKTVIQEPIDLLQLTSQASMATIRRHAGVQTELSLGTAQ